MPVKVSVVIPTYRRPLLLIKCLEALLAQDFPKAEYEIIVVTDGPDEDTRSVVNEAIETGLFSNLVCYSPGTKRGPAAARNAGWKMAKGKLILFTDDDCMPAPGWIRQYYDACIFYSEPVMAFTGKVIVPRSKKPTDFELNTAHLETAAFVTANCACTKSALEAVGGFNEAFTMAWREDSDLEFKLIEKGIPIKKIHEAVVVHPARNAAWGVSLKEQKKALFDALLFKTHPELYKQRIHSPVIKRYLLMIFLFFAFIVFWHYEKKWPAIICLSCWLVFTISFMKKRLSNTSHSFAHVTEMIATSILIPFISVFWNLYGALKFKALHL
jgi:glycosyltransferase involved in cell wall biosynthesis